VHLLIALFLDAIVLHVDHVHVNKNCVLVVCGHGQLGNFNLSLLHVINDFKVKFELLLTVDRLLEAHLGVFELLNNVLLLTFKEHNEVSEGAESLLVRRFKCLHFNSDLPLVDNALELLWIDFSKHVAITLEVIHFLFLQICDLL